MKLFGIFQTNHLLIALLAALIVAFGQPAWFWWSGLLASMFGYALIWGVTLNYENKWHRFFLTGAWFMLVQLIQLSWLISHPYFYIYPVYILFSLLLGVQFGFLGFFITPANLHRFTFIAAIAGFWTLTEWSRLFAFSGFSWNPVGIALAAVGVARTLYTNVLGRGQELRFVADTRIQVQLAPGPSRHP